MKKGPRVPLELQEVFIASQRAEQVYRMPSTEEGLEFGFCGRTRRAGRRKPVVGSDDPNSPKAFLESALKERGYSTKKYNSLETGYYCKPTPLQQASHGILLSQAVRSSDSRLLQRLLESGLSPNPCNKFGESLVHTVCRRGDRKLLSVMLKAGCTLQVCDEQGRTPLHDACWGSGSSLEVAKMIIETDKDLLNLLDSRGLSPLEYVRKENYSKWIAFLAKHLDTFWPKRDIVLEGEEQPSELLQREPQSKAITDPLHALPLSLVALVANGRMSPEEAVDLFNDTSDDEDFSSDDEECYFNDSDLGYDYESSDDSSDEDGDFYDSIYDSAEMKEFCLRAGGPAKVARRAFGNESVQFFSHAY